MWPIAKYYGVPTTVMELLRSWYKGIISCVRLDGDDRDWFSIRTALFQGCVMSPLLFNVYMNPMMRR